MSGFKEALIRQFHFTEQDWHALFTGALFIPAILSGYLLSNSGAPYNTWLVTGHKLSALVGIILVNYTVYQVNQTTPLSGSQWTAAVAMNLCFAGTIASGAMLTMNGKIPGWIQDAHHYGPWLSILSSAVMFYILER